MVQEDTRKLVQKCGFKAITANFIEDVKDSKCEVHHQPVVAYEDSGSGIYLVVFGFVPTLL